MRTLYAGPFIGEFGWHCMMWQGYVRQFAKCFSRCVVACKSDERYLYEDFADSLLECDLEPQRRHCASARRYKRKTFAEIFGCELGEDDQWLPPNEPVCLYDWQGTADSELHRAIHYQQFVQYGEPGIEDGYDVLIHARNRSRARERNWHEQYWHALLDQWPSASVACIGSVEESKYIRGDDLRGVPSERLCNVIASSGYLVSPSSGVVHLAALCRGDCKIVTWFGSPYTSINQRRYLIDWNPFGKPTEALHDARWNIKPDEVGDAIEYFCMMVE